MYKQEEMRHLAHVRQWLLALLLVATGFWILMDTQSAYAQTGSITIEKVDGTTNNTQSFTFSENTSGAASTFALTGGQSNGLGSLGAGTYTISEAVPSSWILTSIDCGGASVVYTPGNNSTFVIGAHDGVAITIAGDEAVTCTFTNNTHGSYPHGGIRLVKACNNPPASPPAFPFTASSGVVGGTFNLGCGAGRTIDYLAPNTNYTFGEGTLPAGWQFDGVTCTEDGTPVPASKIAITGQSLEIINLQAAEDFVCIFTNEPTTTTGSITVEKVDGTNGNTQSFSFTEGANAFSLTGGQSNTLGSLSAGTYTISEAVPSSWILTDIDCGGASVVYTPGNNSTFVIGAHTGVAVTIAGNDAVTCTFTNNTHGSYPHGGIRLVKACNTPPASPPAFPFTASSGVVGGTFNLGCGAGRTIDYLAPNANYTFGEGTLPANWQFVGVSCTEDGNPVPASKIAISGQSLEIINLQAAEDFVCTFTNEPTGVVVPGQSITLVKDDTTDSNTPFILFSHTGTGYILTDNGSGAANSTTLALDPSRTYGFNESPTSGWQLTGVNCVDLDDNTVSSTVTTSSTGVQITLAAGEHLTCTFTNAPDAGNSNGSISIIKDAGGSTDDFSFTTPWGTVTLDDASPDDNDGVINFYTTGNTLPAGSYTISENIPAGWDLTNLSCTGGTSTTYTFGADATFDAGETGVAINLAAGENIVCTFTNQVGGTTGKITIVKDASPNDPQDFSFTASGGTISPASFMLDDDGDPTLSNTQVYAGLAPGTYDFTEVATAGWTLASPVTCTGAGGSTAITDGISVTIAAGDDITCTFVNNKDVVVPTTGKITIVKDAVPNDPQDFSFTASGGTIAPTNFTLDDDGDPTLSNTQVYAGLAPGTYDFAEASTAGWTLASPVTCTGTGSSTAITDGISVTIAAGDDITCTFVNNKDGAATTGSIEVCKHIHPHGYDPQDFMFTASGGAITPANFSLDYDEDPTLDDCRIFPNLAADTYTFQEVNLPANWHFDTVGCVIEATDTSSYTRDLAAKSIEVNLAAGEDIFCRFFNNKKGNIIIEKQTDPAGDTTPFEFNSDIATPFSIAGGSVYTISNVISGTYHLTESVTAGWALTSIDCSSDPTGDSSGDIATGAAMVTVADGEDVRCVFTNTKNGSITIEKQTDPDGDTTPFTFTSPLMTTQLADGESATVSAVPGSYSVSETAVAGWNLTGITCNDADSTGDVSSSTATINVSAGEDVTCVFTNTKDGSITIEKQTDPDGNTTAFDFTGDVTGQLADGQNTTVAVAPGSYSVSETALAGWNLTGITCNDADSTGAVSSSTATINVSAGEDVTCVFTNTASSSITIEKQTLPDGDTTAFEFTGDVTGQLADGESITVAVLPGTYSVVETAVAGWNLYDVYCEDEQIDTVSNREINVSMGENVTCTFTNVKDGYVPPGTSITIRKETLPDGDTTAFEFTGDVTAQLADGESVTVGVSPGIYSVSETPLAGWDLTGIECEDDQINSGPDINNDNTADISVSEGEAVVCVFTNTAQDGSITIEKQTLPDGDTTAFDFTGDVTGQLADGQSTTISVAPGNYSVSETALAGWNLTGITCNDADSTGNVSSSTATINISAGEDVTCIFTNTKDGSITIEKQTLPDGNTTAFDFTGDVTGQLADGQNTTVAVAPGSYSVSETAVAGWNLTGITCTDPSNDSSGDINTGMATINVGAGEDITCVFTNTEGSSITIEKQTLPDGDTTLFDFTGDIPGQLADGQSMTVLVAPGNYSVSETAQAGWNLTDITCNDINSGPDINDDSIADIWVDAGEAVTCVFTNTKDGSITIEKQTNPDGDTTLFDFTGDVSGQLADGQSTTVVVAPGAYSVSETALAGWNLTGITCNDTDSTGDVSSNTATINVSAGEDVTCVFTNTEGSSITIQKQTLPDGDTTPFDFTGDVTGQLADGQSTTVVVAPGNYSVSETAVAGWNLTSITCDDADSSDVGTGIADINVSAGEAVTCVFTNTKDGSITIEKQTNPDGNTTAFDFTGAVTGQLADNQSTTVAVSPGSYSVSETALAGWNLTGLSCNDADSTGDVSSSTATINVSAGEDVTCVFTNTEGSSITIEKQTLPDGNTTLFDFTGDVTGQMADGQSTTILVAPGTYSVSETVVAGWNLTNITCSDADSTGDVSSSTASINVSAGEAVTCVFTNTEDIPDGSITIEKQTNPDGDTTAFDFTGAVSGQLADGQSTSVSVAPGSYSVSETALAGWNLTDITCDDADSTGDVSSNTATINVSAGEAVTCVFTNTQDIPDGSITIQKMTDPAGSSTTFSFMGDIVTTLTDGQSDSATVAPGTYSIIESVAAGWALTNITCNDTNSSGNVAANEATFVVEAGEDVVCVFTNTKLGVDITLDKAVAGTVDGDGSGTLSVGDLITYTFDVANTGDALLSNVAVTDDKVGTVSCPESTLAPAGSMLCTATYTVMQSDVDSGQIVNNASVSGSGPEGDEATAADSVTTDLPRESSLDLVKNLQTDYVDADGSDTITLNDILTYEFIVTNNSNVTLNNMTVADPLAGLSAVDCAPLTNGSITLVPDQQVICTATYTVAQSDVNNGTITNTATATATGPDGAVSDGGSEETNVAQSPSILLEKTMASSVDADGSGTVSEGDTLTYQLDVTNNGTVILTNVSIADPLPGLSAINCGSETNGSITLNPGNAVSCTATYVVTAQDAINGQVDNRATATADSPNGDDPSSEDSTSTAVSGVTPHVESTKQDALATDADGDGVPSPGDTLLYTVVITSNGNYTATDVAFSDIVDSNTTLVVGTVNTSIGTVTLGNNVDDAAVTVAVGDMAVNAVATITFEVVINRTVADGVMTIHNQGMVSQDGQPDEPTDDPETPADDDPTSTAITATPLIEASKTDSYIDKDGDGQPSPGDEIEYRITVFNNGNQTGLAAFVNDPLDPNTTLVVGSVTTSQGTVAIGNSDGDTDIEIDLGSITPGSNIVIVFRVSINNPLPAGVTTVVNQGFVRGDNFPTQPTDDPDTTGEDSTQTPVTATPSVEATKSDMLFEDIDGDGVPSPGDILIYNVTIINTGNAAATGIIFTDNVDSNTNLIPESVSTSAGAVAVGNDAADSSVVVNVGTLTNPGDRVDINFQVRINSPLLASVQLIENQGIVTGDAFTPELTDDPDTDDNDDPTITALNASALLEASKSDTLFIDADDNGSPSPGDTLLYEVNIINLGNSSASSVVFTDSIDPNTTIIPGTVQSSQGMVATGNVAGESTIKILIGSLPGNNGQATISFRVTINDPLAAGVTAISNQGRVEADGIASFNTSDPDGDGPTTTSIQAIAELSVTKEDFLLIDSDKNLDPRLEGPSSGDTLLYVITVANSGNSAAANVVLTDTPDANTTLIPGTVQSDIGTILTGNGTDDTDITVNIGTIPGGESATIGFSVKINEGVSVATLSNQASVTADGLAGASGLVSTDPGTEQVDAPTVTTLSTLPTALGTIAEPMKMQFSSFLPITLR